MIKSIFTYGLLAILTTNGAMAADDDKNRVIGAMEVGTGILLSGETVLLASGEDGLISSKSIKKELAELESEIAKKKYYLEVEKNKLAEVKSRIRSIYPSHWTQVMIDRQREFNDAKERELITSIKRMEFQLANAENKIPKAENMLVKKKIAAGIGVLTAATAISYDGLRRLSIIESNSFHQKIAPPAAMHSVESGVANENEESSDAK